MLNIGGAIRMPRSRSAAYYLTLLILAVVLAMAFCGFAMSVTAEVGSKSTQVFAA